MSLFLLAIFGLYGALHYYIFTKIDGAVSLGSWGTISLLLLMAIMVAAPVIVQISEKHGFETLARLISYIGYTWMGIAFLFFSFSFLIDLHHLLVHLLKRLLQQDLSWLTLSPTFAFLIPMALAVTIAFYGYFEALNIRNETVVIRSPKIPQGIGTLRIAQISDVHLGLMVRQERLKRILRIIESVKPHLLVSTGDLVDGQIDGLKGLAELLDAIQPKYGKFAVTGNHDFYAGLDHSLRFTERAGFRILRGEAVTVGGVINVVGVDDPTGKYFGLSKEISESALLSSLSAEHFTLFLKHRPTVEEGSLGLFDLQLSGHTHKGQIFPFTFLQRLFFPHDAGLIALPHRAYLYVNRGSGTWGPPIRFLSPPEVTVIDLVGTSIKL